MSDIPDYPKGYENWLKREHKVTVDKRMRRHYESVTRDAVNYFSDCRFWQDTIANLKEIDASYQMMTGYPLIFDYFPSIVEKPFNSFLQKTYRKNIVHNNNFPLAPAGGWLLPYDWFSQINDIVRTTITVKYLDGVKILIDQLDEIALNNSIKIESELEARADGYYAAHLYYRADVEIPSISFDTVEKPMVFEVQITTQIKEIIKRLIHKYYEGRRIVDDKSGGDWGWNYKSDEFTASYLGHILHYVEGMIIEVRDRERERENQS